MLAPSFVVYKIKLDLLPKFLDKPSDLTGWSVKLISIVELLGLHD